MKKRRRCSTRGCMGTTSIALGEKGPRYCRTCRAAQAEKRRAKRRNSPTGRCFKCNRLTRRVEAAIKRFYCPTCYHNDVVLGIREEWDKAPEIVPPPPQKLSLPEREAIFRQWQKDR